MSVIYLPTGAKITLHDGWTESVHPDGTRTYRKSDQTYIGSISPHGVIHLSDVANYTYYPPGIDDIDAAFTLIVENKKKISTWKLKQLKKELEKFNAKSGYWKQ